MVNVTLELHDRVVIGEGDSKIVITVCNTKINNRVSLGIEAPDDARIFREEVYERLQEEARLAKQVTP